MDMDIVTEVHIKEHLEESKEFRDRILLAEATSKANATRLGCIEDSLRTLMLEFMPRVEEVLSALNGSIKSRGLIEKVDQHETFITEVKGVLNSVRAIGFTSIGTGLLIIAAFMFDKFKG